MTPWKHTYAVVAIAALGASAIAAAQAAQPQASPAAAEALLGEALHQQDVEGDLQAAAATYKKVLTDPAASREVRATARAALAKIENQLAQQPRAERTAGSTARRIFTHPGNVIWGGPSPDGRFLALTDFSRGGNLVIRDLRSGEMRQLTRTASAGSGSHPEYAGVARFSPDGRRVVFGWKTPTGYQLRSIDLTGGEPQILLAHPEHEWIGVVGWSADGRRLLTKVNLKGNVGQIAWFSMTDQSLRPLRTLPWTSLGEVALDPDGRHIAYDARTAEGQPMRSIFILAADGSTQIDVTNGRARDRVVGWMPGGATLLFLSDRSGAAEMWALPFSKGAVVGIPRFVSRDMAGATPLGITTSGTLIYTTTRSTGDLYVASMDWSTGEATNSKRINGNVMVDFLGDWSPDGERVAYVAHRGTALDRRFIVTQSLDGKDRQEITPSDDLQIFVNGGNQWSQDGRSFLVTGGTAGHRQGAFNVDVATGKARLLASRPGAQVQLPQLVAGGKSLLYRVRDNLKPTSEILVRNIEDGTDRQIVHGLEHAQHMSVAASPDDRLLAFHPADPNIPASINVMPLAGGTARRLLEVPQDEELWITGWTPDSRYIIYTRRPGAGPARQAPQLWAIPVEGGSPRQLRLPEPTGDMRAHRDGRRILYRVGRVEVEMWKLDNLTALIGK